MLTPNQLDQVPDSLVELYSKAELDILQDMVRRITTYDFFIPAAEYQFRKLQDMGLLYDEIIKKLSAMSGITNEQIEILIKEAGAQSLKIDDSIYRKAGLRPTPLDASPAMQAVLSSGIAKTSRLFKNLTKTTASTASKQFEDLLDRAYMQITTGAFDYNTAIRMAVKDLSSKGVASITYPAKNDKLGHTDYMDVAVRRAVLTGVNQTSAHLQLARMDEMECDLVEATAHVGARPEHQLWQGKVFSRGGKSKKYPDFVENTGYGTGEGLCGWNCRHNFFPFFEGVSEPAYSKIDLEDMNALKYEYNGKKMTEHEAVGKQRQIERNIRKWKREYVGMETAGLPTEEAVSKIAKWQNAQKDFLKQTGLKRQVGREQIGGYGKSQAGKVTQANKKAGKVANRAKSDIINHKVVNAMDSTVPKALKFNDNSDWIPDGAKIENVHIIAGKDVNTKIRVAETLAEKYGGKANEWMKKVGKVSSMKYDIDIHWYEHSEIGPVDHKVKNAKERSAKK